VRLLASRSKLGSNDDTDASGRFRQARRTSRKSIPCRPVNPGSPRDPGRQGHRVSRGLTLRNERGSDTFVPGFAGERSAGAAGPASRIAAAALRYSERRETNSSVERSAREPCCRRGRSDGDALLAATFFGASRCRSRGPARGGGARRLLHPRLTMWAPPAHLAARSVGFMRLSIARRRRATAESQWNHRVRVVCAALCRSEMVPPRHRARAGFSKLFGQLGPCAEENLHTRLVASVTKPVIRA
jgi:hypothetical protein